MSAPKKQKPKAEEELSAQHPAAATAAPAPVSPTPHAIVAESGVTVASTFENRPDDAHAGEVIVAPADAQLEATAPAPAAAAGLALEAPAAPQGNARALRRLEHDGTVYGPGEPAGDVLKLTADQLASLEPTGAIETI